MNFFLKNEKIDFESGKKSPVLKRTETLEDVIIPLQ